MNLDTVGHYLLDRLAILNEEKLEMEQKNNNHLEEYGQLLARLDEVETLWDIINK